jgi:hypothetical protein
VSDSESCQGRNCASFVPIVPEAAARRAGGRRVFRTTGVRGADRTSGDWRHRLVRCRSRSSS